VRSITQQLSDALARTGWSVGELLKRSRLPVDRSSLARKLKGSLPMKTTEAEALAIVLGTYIGWPERRAKARRAA
jgi:hypothetical protein